MFAVVSMFQGDPHVLSVSSTRTFTVLYTLVAAVAGHKMILLCNLRTGRQTEPLVGFHSKYLN